MSYPPYGTLEVQVDLCDIAEMDLDDSNCREMIEGFVYYGEGFVLYGRVTVMIVNEFNDEVWWHEIEVEEASCPGDSDDEFFDVEKLRKQVMELLEYSDDEPPKNMDIGVAWWDGKQEPVIGEIRIFNHGSGYLLPVRKG